jgi:hypothetical protein
VTETASTVIRDALQELLVQASEQPIQSNEATDAIRYLNRMMFAWEAKGVALGYTVVSSLGDTVTVPDGALEGIVLNLAIKLAPQYDVAVSMDLRENARDAYKSILKLSITQPLSQYPSTLPIGSGNDGDSFDNHHFYETDTNTILSETTGTIVQESGN